MRFCMITTFYPPHAFGGDGIFVQNLAHALASRGHEVHVVHCVDSYQPIGGQASAPESDCANITIHGLKSPAGLLSPLATHQTGRPWFKAAQITAILNQGFDVIHYHNISLVGGPKLLEYGAGIKLYTFHEYFLVCSTNLLFRFQREPCSRRSCFRCSLAHGRPPQLWRSTGLIERSVRHVDTFLSPSRFGMEMHRRLGLNAPMIYLPNFAPAQPSDDVSPEPQSEPYFLYVGRLERIKGPHTLIEPFLRWGKTRLILAGAGSSESDLRKMAASSDRIQFAGHVNGAALRALYRGAVAVIVPSLTYELFPLVILEALREGTPVVVRNLGSLPEPVEESGGGLIYNDSVDLIAALDKLLADGPLRDELGRNGQRHYHATWTEEPHLRRYFQIIGDHQEARRRKGGSA